MEKNILGGLYDHFVNGNLTIQINFWFHFLLQKLKNITI